LPKSMKRKTFANAGNVVAPSADFGPEIRRRDIAVPARTRVEDGEVIVVEPGYTREADTLVTRRPDPDRPDRQQDIEVAVRWLPHRLHKQGHMTKDQLAAAAWYRDLIDRAAGTSDRTLGHYGASDPSQRSIEMGPIDYMVQASIALQRADVAMGVDRATLMRVAVMATTKTDIALAIGIAATRVPAAVAEVFETLDEWRGRYGTGR
jgi:hypothetical protein